MGAAQRFDDVEVFFAWNAKDLLDTLILKGGDEQVGAFHGLQSSLGGADEQFSADAILDRVIHNAYRIELAGESMRKRRMLEPST